MIVGTVVLLKTPMLGEEMHAIGVVFYDYGDGVQVIFEKGGYDGFSKEEQTSFLMEKGYDEMSSLYRFKNVMQVSRDYEDGFWNSVFENPKYRPRREF